MSPTPQTMGTAMLQYLCLLVAIVAFFLVTYSKLHDVKDAVDSHCPAPVVQP